VDVVLPDAGKPAGAHMRLHFALVLVLASSLVASCFRPDLTCLPCRESCPGSLTCQDNYCVEFKEQAPFCQDRWKGDAGSGLPDGPPDVEGPPRDPFVCDDQCCVGNDCLTLTTQMRNGLILWADRTSLPDAGSPVTVWRDRSLLKNDIVAYNFGYAPKVQMDERGPIVEIDEERAVLATKAGPQHRLKRSDFSILVLARCDENTRLGTLFQRHSSDRPSTGLGLFCNHTGGGYAGPVMPAPNRVFFMVEDERQIMTFGDGGAIASKSTFDPGKLRLMVARRISDHIQLRVDGVLEGDVQIPASLSLDDENPSFIGALPTIFTVATTTFNGGIAAVIVVRGPLEDDELAQLESFVLRNFGPPR